MFLQNNIPMKYQMFLKRYTMPFGGVQCAFNKISFERGPQGERGPGREASKISFDRVFAFV